MSAGDRQAVTDAADAIDGLLRTVPLEVGESRIADVRVLIGRQKRLRVGDAWYRVELIFFHRRLRALVVIDLKIGASTHADAGQMHLYLNYAREHWTHEDENPPVGLSLCAEKDAAVSLERVLGSADAGAVEEDARLTTLFLWTLQSTEAPADNGGDKRVGQASSLSEQQDAGPTGSTKGFSLPFDVVRRLAQPMGIDLTVWTDRVIGQDKGIVRLLPVAERAKALFGEDGARAAADWIESDPGGSAQGVLLPEQTAPPKEKTRRGRKAIVGGDSELQSPDATTLDRVHAAMLRSPPRARRSARAAPSIPTSSPSISNRWSAAARRTH